uniref:Uncharacterized protein n=1 Tax=Arundo donax TaxID=35708 RepID=A0A0A9HI43_ARUDO
MWHLFLNLPSQMRDPSIEGISLVIAACCL